MALSAEKVMMIGIGALGAFAIYKLLIAPKDQSPEPPAQTEPASDPRETHR